MSNAWVKEFPGAVIVADAQGSIIEMNDKAIKNFEKYGGKALIGKNLLEIHPEPSRTKVAEILEKRVQNSYTIEKNGIKKLVHQSPWYSDGEYKGFLDLSLEIPMEMPHYIRKP
jgi:PAS domain S-box-containing protein